MTSLYPDAEAGARTERRHGEVHRLIAGYRSLDIQLPASRCRRIPLRQTRMVPRRAPAPEKVPGEGVDQRGLDHVVDTAAAVLDLFRGMLDKDSRTSSSISRVALCVAATRAVTVVSALSTIFATVGRRMKSRLT